MMLQYPTLQLFQWRHAIPHCTYEFHTSCPGCRKPILFFYLSEPEYNFKQYFLYILQFIEFVKRLYFILFYIYRHFNRFEVRTL